MHHTSWQDYMPCVVPALVNSFHPLRPLHASGVEIPLNNHAQSAQIDGALDDDEENGSHHNHGLDHICPDNGLQSAGCCVEYADEAHDWRDDMYIYSSYWKSAQKSARGARFDGASMFWV